MCMGSLAVVFFFFKQKTAYEMRISDWSSDVCSSDLTAQPDGERILTWEQVYDLTEVPTDLIVVGSGVTGAEFASAYLALGIPVTLVSSRDREIGRASCRERVCQYV